MLKIKTIVLQIVSKSKINPIGVTEKGYLNILLLAENEYITTDNQTVITKGGTNTRRVVADINGQ